MTINQQDSSLMQSSIDTIHSDDTTEDSIDITHLRTPIKVDLSPVYNFLGARTTQAWVDAAMENLPMIIQDHANCEKRPLVLP